MRAQIFSVMVLIAMSACTRSAQSTHPDLASSHQDNSHHHGNADCDKREDFLACKGSYQKVKDTCHELDPKQHPGVRNTDDFKKNYNRYGCYNFQGEATAREHFETCMRKDRHNQCDFLIEHAHEYCVLQLENDESNFLPNYPRSCGA